MRRCTQRQWRGKEGDGDADYILKRKVEVRWRLHFMENIITWWRIRKRSR